MSNAPARDAFLFLHRRVGIAEAKHTTGMHQFLDDMRARFPDILQENCSSGGRRIDIQMTARARTYCRSDYYTGRKPRRYDDYSGPECPHGGARPNGPVLTTGKDGTDTVGVGWRPSRIRALAEGCASPALM